MIWLQTLYLNSYGRLTCLLETIGSSVKLQFLDLSAFNNLKSLSDAIGGLASLQTLNLNLCVKLSCLPETIGNLVRLQTLDVTCCFGLKKPPRDPGANDKSRIFFCSYVCLNAQVTRVYWETNCFERVELPQLWWTNQHSCSYWEA